jgi:hypothetical protein
VADTSDLQTRVIQEFVRRITEAPELDAAVKERIVNIARNPERAKAEHIKAALLGEGEVK